MTVVGVGGVGGVEFGDLPQPAAMVKVSTKTSDEPRKQCWKVFMSEAIETAFDVGFIIKLSFHTVVVSFPPSIKVVFLH